MTNLKWNYFRQCTICLLLLRLFLFLCHVPKHPAPLLPPRQVLWLRNLRTTSAPASISGTSARMTRSGSSSSPPLSKVRRRKFERKQFWEAKKHRVCAYRFLFFVGKVCFYWYQLGGTFFYNWHKKYIFPINLISNSPKITQVWLFSVILPNHFLSFYIPHPCWRISLNDGENFFSSSTPQETAPITSFWLNASHRQVDIFIIT